MSRLYLHIGTHKTGTTSIQRFMASNRELLQKQGLIYPDNRIGGFRGHYAHHRIAHAIASEPDRGTPDDARAFFDVLRNRLATDETAVVSAEAMYRHVLPSPLGTSGRLYDGGAAVLGDPLEYIRTVRECIGDFDVTVLVMLRRQDRFIESLYAEEIMSSSYTQGIHEFIENRSWLADYDARLAMWGQIFGSENLSVRLFDPGSFGVPIERYFVEWLGGTWDNRFQLGGPYNVTVPRSLVEYKRALNDQQPRSVSTTYRKWLEELSSDEFAASLPELGGSYLTVADRLDMMRSFEEGNSRVSAEYVGRPSLFELADLESGFDDPEELSSSDFLRITRLLLRNLAHRPAANR